MSSLAVIIEVGVEVSDATRSGGPIIPLTLLLLVLVWRRSTVARGFVVVLAMVGAIVFGLGAVFGDTDRVSHALTALAFLGQALPLLTPAVRDHVQKRDVAASPAAAA